MSIDNRPIGVLDSGVGGLTVIKECINLLPNENFIFYADTKNSPYGSKSVNELIGLAKKDIEFLIEKGVKIIVIACNTVSANTIEVLRNEYDIPIVEVIEPAVEEAVRHTKNKKVGVIATEATINSHVYNRKLKDRGITEVIEVACPSFVPFIESGIKDKDFISNAIKHDAGELKNKEMDVLILGCTHFPLIKEYICDEFSNIEIVNPARRTAEILKTVLETKRIFSDKRSYIRVYSSKKTDILEGLCAQIDKSIIVI